VLVREFVSDRSVAAVVAEPKGNVRDANHHSIEQTPGNFEVHEANRVCPPMNAVPGWGVSAFPWRSGTAMSGTHYESQFFTGFTFSGNQNLDALAGFYGFAVHSLEPRITLAEYLARTCYGRPCPGYRIMIGGVELIVLELQEGAITKVGLRVLPHESSRQRRRLPAGAGYDVGASLVRWNRTPAETAALFR
jgi:hypothetical protein